MSRKNRFLVLAALCAAWIIPLAAQSIPAIGGVWTGKVVLGNGTTDPISVTLKKDGQSYTGTIVDELGYMPEGTEFIDVTLKGNDLSLSFKANGGGGIVVIKSTLTVNGDTMTGRWDDEQYGESGTVELARKK